MKTNNLLKNFLRHASSIDTLAFSIFDGEKRESISYRKFSNDVLCAANSLMKRHIRSQHIALLAPNSYLWIVNFFSILASGNVPVPLNPDVSKGTILRHCEKADVSVIFADTSTTSDFDVADSTIKILSLNNRVDEMPMSLDEVYSAGPDETILLMFTSGTTGSSKVVAYSANNIRSLLIDAREQVCNLDMHSSLLCLPLYHAYGVLSVITLLYQYKTICIGRGMRYLIADMSVLNPATVNLVPSVLDSLVKLLKKAGTAEERQRYIGHNLTSITIGGASAQPAVCYYMMELGIRVLSAYGMTESAGAGTSCILNEYNMGSIGKPYGKTQCRIENGELLLKSPAVMKGYYKDPEATAKIIVNGWLHTGDIASCDERGFYYIIGRKKNVIILSNGENVNPEEIEAKWAEFGPVLECLVYGDGRGICADVYTTDKPGAMRYIKAYNESVPTYHQVYKVNYFEKPLKKTASGKIKRKEFPNG